MNMHALLPLLLKIGITLVLALLTLFGAAAQEVPAGSKKLHLKISREENGKTVLTDTTLVVAEDADPLEAIRSLKGDTAFSRVLMPGRFSEANRVKVLRVPAAGMVADTAKFNPLKRARILQLEGALSDEERAAFQERRRSLEQELDVIMLERPLKEKRLNRDSLGLKILQEIEVIRAGDSLGLRKFEDATVIILKAAGKEITPEDKQALKEAGAPVETTLKEELKLEEISYYPNPNKGRFHLSFKLARKGAAVVRVLDSAGREVFTEQVKRQEEEYSREIDISKHGRGIYFVQVAQGKRYLTRKIVVD